MPAEAKSKFFKDKKRTFRSAVFPESINLRPYCNMGFKDKPAEDREDGWADYQGPLMDIGNLSAGRQRFCGVPFDIIDAGKNNGKSFLMVGGSLFGGPSRRNCFPYQADIAVKDKYTTLNFLHGAAWAAQEPVVFSWAVVFSYIIRYNDGCNVEIPIILNKNITNWTRVIDWGNPYILPGAELAWTGKTQEGKDTGLWMCRWVNPYPEKEIAGISVFSQGICVGGIVAICGGKGKVSEAELWRARKEQCLWLEAEDVSAWKYDGTLPCTEKGCSGMSAGGANAIVMKKNRAGSLMEARVELPEAGNYTLNMRVYENSNPFWVKITDDNGVVITDGEALPLPGLKNIWLWRMVNFHTTVKSVSIRLYLPPTAEKDCMVDAVCIDRPRECFRNDGLLELCGGTTVKSLPAIKRWDSREARARINKGDYGGFLKRFNFIHRDFPMRLFPMMKRWFPFYMGNGDLGMLLDPLGANTLSFKYFEYAHESWSSLARPILSANDAFVCKSNFEKGYRKDVWSGAPGGRSCVRGLQVQVDAGPVFDENDDLYKKTGDYHQEMELWDGVCRTRFVYDQTWEVQVDTWLSWQDTRVGVIRYRIINRSSGKREISLHNKLICKYYGKDIAFRKRNGFQYGEVSTQTCKIGLAYTCIGDKNKYCPDEQKMALGKGEKAERIFYFSLTSDAIKGALPEDAIRHAAKVKKRGYTASFDKHTEAVHDFWKKWWVMAPDENIADLYYKSMWIIAGSVGNYYPPSPTSIANPSYSGMGCGDYNASCHILMQSGHFDRISKAEDFFRNAMPKDNEKGFCFPNWHCYFSLWSSYPFGFAGGWIPWMFYTHYRLTGDKAFLKEKAYPLMKAASIFFAENADKTAEGYEFLGEKDGKARDLCSFDETGACVRFTKKPVDNPADLMIAAKWTLQTTADTADMLGVDKKKTGRWREVAFGLHIPQNDKYYIGFKGDDFEKRRRVQHPAMLTGVCPIPLLEDEKMERTYPLAMDKMQKTTKVQTWNKAWHHATRLRLSKILDDLVYNSFYRWNFGLSIDRAQLAEFCSNNGSPRPNFYYLEVHAVVAGGVNEIMLQSHKGIIKVFPCVPARWKNESFAFSGLLAEGGFRISASYEKGEIPCIEIESLVGSTCRLESPLKWNSVSIKDKNNRSISYKMEKTKARIDGKEETVDVVEFNTVSGAGYILKGRRK